MRYSSSNYHVRPNSPTLTLICSSDFEREKTWRRIAGGFKEGNSCYTTHITLSANDIPPGLCLITVGTGERLSIKQVGPMSLLSAHCYAVTGKCRSNGISSDGFGPSLNPLSFIHPRYQ